MKKQHLLLYIAALLLFSACTGESRRMQALLEQAEEMNRTDQPFLSDSIGKALVHHYDHWWHSRNLRMRAYYMLGCAYRDMGSAPRALENYQRAVSIADTTQADCDLNVLMRVHSQMSKIFSLQHLHEYKKIELEIAKRLAWNIGDTLSALIFEEKFISSLYQNREYEDCIQKALALHDIYERFGYTEEALLAYSLCINSCLRLKDYTQAKHFLNLYENCRYFKNMPQNVDGRTGALYVLKGEYFLGIGQIDSAENYFQRALPYKIELPTYKGLYQVYEQKRNADSVLKYTKLYSVAKEKHFDESQNFATLQTKNLYDYSIEQQEANENAKEATRLKNYVYLCFVGLTACIAAVSSIMYRQKRKELKFHKLLQNHEYALDKLQDMEEELSSMKKEKIADNNTRTELNWKIEMQKDHIRRLEEVMQKKENRKRDVNLLETNIVERFVKACQPMLGQDSSIKDRHWKELRDTIETIYPNFYDVMNGRQKLSEKEYRVCLLVKAHFSNSNIETLMGQKSSYACNAKKRLCKKVFGYHGTAAHFEQRLHLT